MGKSSLYQTTSSNASGGCGERVSHGSIATPPDTADTLIASRGSVADDTGPWLRPAAREKGFFLDLKITSVTSKMTKTKNSNHYDQW